MNLILTQPQRRELEKAVKLAIRVGNSGDARYHTEILWRVLRRLRGENEDSA